jgi:hypothetical protein
MNVEIGTEAALFPIKEYINGNFLAVCPFNNFIFSLHYLDTETSLPFAARPFFNLCFSDLQERMGPKLWAGPAGLLPWQEEGRGGQCHESSQQDCRRIHCQGQVSDQCTEQPGTGQ